MDHVALVGRRDLRRLGASGELGVAGWSTSCPIADSAARISVYEESEGLYSRPYRWVMASTGFHPGSSPAPGAGHSIGSRAGEGNGRTARLGTGGSGPRMRDSRGMLRRFSLLVVLALVAAACSGAPDTSGSEIGPNGGDVTAGDLILSLPSGALSGTGRLSVVRRGLPKPAPHGVDVHGQAAEVTLKGASLTGEAKVSFAVPPEINGTDSRPVIVWEDDQGGWRWLPAEWSPGDARITATLDHFSTGFLGKIDIQKWAPDRAEEVKNYVTGRSGVDQPSCGDEAGVRAEGVTVESDGGDSIKWCFGNDGGKQVLRVANNKRAYTQVAFPESWEVVDGGSFGLSLEAINRTVSSSLGDITSPKGKNVRLLAGGSTLTVAVPAGSSGTATAEISMFAWLFSGMQLGVDMYADVASLAGAALRGPTRNSWSRIVNRLIGAEPLGGYEDALRECTRAVSDHITDTPFASSATASAGKPLLKAAWSCVPVLMQADINETGVRMFGLGMVLSVIGGVVGAILTAAHLLVTSIREIWDSFASFAGSSDARYDIRVTSRGRAVAECSTARMAKDLGPSQSRDLAIVEPGCVNGWAIVNLYASCRAECGDTLGLVQLVDRRWRYVGGFPGPFCVDEARARGVPHVFLGRFAPCTSAPASRTPTCGTVTSKTGTPLTVTVAKGSVSCPDALALANTYFHDPPETPQGSSGSVQIGPWLCASNSAAGTAQSGRAGGCHRDDTGDEVELRTP